MKQKMSPTIFSSFFLCQIAGLSLCNMLKIFRGGGSGISVDYFLLWMCLYGGGLEDMNMDMNINMYMYMNMFMYGNCCGFVYMEEAKKT